MKIYTRTGDTGVTGLYGGQRVGKDDIRVEAYGTVDEANAALGVAVAHLENAELREIGTRLMSELFVVGADLATPLQREQQAGKSIVPRVAEEHWRGLEDLIDHLEEQLPPLTSFILPGGSKAAAFLHQARSVLRRAERRAVSLYQAHPEGINPEVLRYLNRLNDLVFVLARAANHRAGVPDIPWTRPD